MRCEKLQAALDILAGQGYDKTVGEALAELLALVAELDAMGTATQELADLGDQVATLLRWCDDPGGAHLGYIAIADIRHVFRQGYKGKMLVGRRPKPVEGNTQALHD